MDWLLVWLAQAATATDLTGIAVQTTIGGATVGALVWGVSKIVAMFERMQENEQARTNTVIESLQTIIGQIRIAESARTEAAMKTIESQVTLLGKLTENHANAIAQILKTQESARDVLHDLRGLTTDIAAQKRYAERAHTDA